jgi:hypothetical protein
MNNDRFKFRLWHNGDKKYHDADYTSSKLGQDGRLWQYGNPEDEEEYTIEQSTGIRDANDILIYEGDIVQTITGAIGEVRWLNSGFVAVYSGHLITFGAVCGTMKVIGNIHERE